MANKDSVIFYNRQIDICREHLTAEQFGRLMFALFELSEGEDPEVAEDISLAYEFMSLQQRIDQEKYAEKCQKNRENGKKGGAPKGNQNARKQPKQANGLKNNPNDNDKTMKREGKENGNEDNDYSVVYGRFKNVHITGQEYYTLKEDYERVTDLINKVSVWLRTHEAEDHFALCIKFAENDDWPRRKKIEPVKPIEVEDPLSEEEQEEKMTEMRAKIVGAFPSS